MSLPLTFLLALQSIPVVQINNRSIRFDDAREKLTLEYRRAHQDPKATDTRISPKMIVIHHTAVATFESSFKYLDRIELESKRKELHSAGRVNVSAHFLIDRDGTIYRLMPETRMARHCIGLNHVAIGIENVGGTKDSPLTDAQLHANAMLIRDLVSRFPITHVIGHHEYRALEKHAYFLEKDPNYRTEKIDPGPEFMKRLRAEIADFSLSGI